MGQPVINNLLSVCLYHPQQSVQYPIRNIRIVVADQRPSGACDPDQTAIMLFQTCGACRATNYLNLMRAALKDAGYGQVPAFAFIGRESETDDFVLSQSCYTDVVKAVIYGDLLMRVKNRVKPYEIEPGSTERLYRIWMTRAKEELSNSNYFKYRRNFSIYNFCRYLY